jgi:lipopolysaccharide/colanic/teichoic acid biosynthesis glycosyltransferase
MRTITEQTPRLLEIIRGLRGVHGQADIDRMIHRETARADRTGHEFSLVLFRVKSNVRFSVSSHRLVKTVMKRVRNTDEMGWFDEKHLCAVLPDTGAAGAWRFAEDVCDLVALRSPRPIFVVYTYPTDWLDTGTPVGPSSTERRRDSDDNNHRGNGSGGGGASNGRQHNGNAMTPVINGPAATSQGHFISASSSGDLAETMTSKPLENLLVQRMPIWKRSIDIFGAIIGLIVASPLFLLAIVGMKITEPRGPIIFKQRRSGLGGRPFWIFKFRTMCVGAEKMRDELKKHSEQDGPAFKMKHDPRVTRIGRLLRKTSIDELPQLFNILKGDMTLVGPRPLPISEQTACQMWQRRRLDVTPGLTCIWQVRGRSQVTFTEWMRMDLRYIRRRTLWHDISLLALTVKSVLTRKGAV